MSETILLAFNKQGSGARLDGDVLGKEVWRRQPWSADFEGITGEEDTAPPGDCRTRVKMVPEGARAHRLHNKHQNTLLTL